MAKAIIRVTYTPTGEKLAEGPKGWGITPFEGNLYIQNKYLLTDKLKVNFIPGFCFYKFLYVWMDFDAENGHKSKMIGWKYFLPNPLFPFIWYRVGLPRMHPELLIEEFEIAEEANEPAISRSGRSSG